MWSSNLFLFCFASSCFPRFSQSRFFIVQVFHGLGPGFRSSLLGQLPSWKIAPNPNHNPNRGELPSETYYETSEFEVELCKIEEQDKVMENSYVMFQMREVVGLSQMFYKRGLLKNFANFTGKCQCWSLFLINLQG